MPSTVLIFLPIPTGNPASTTDTPSPTAKIITHITRTYHPTPLDRNPNPYTLDHKLLVDTTSLISAQQAQYDSNSNNNNNNSRPPPPNRTHILTLPNHFPGKTFVGTTSTSSTNTNTNTTTYNNPNANPTHQKPQSHPSPLALTTLPSTNSLFPLLTTSMTPLWTTRAIHRIDRNTGTGTSTAPTTAAFRIGRDWTLRIGELIAFSSAAGGATGRHEAGITMRRGGNNNNSSSSSNSVSKGCVFELGWAGHTEEEGEQEEEEKEVVLAMVDAFFRELIGGSGVEINKEYRVLGPVAGSDGDGLVRAYMDLLTFMR